MQIRRYRVFISFGILVLGLLVPFLPNACIVLFTSKTITNKYVYIFELWEDSVYMLTVFPFLLLALVSWVSLINENLSKDSFIKRVSGIGFSFTVICYWGLGVSMPTVWGLAALFFSGMSLVVLPVTYSIGYFIGNLIVKRIRKQK